MIKISDRRFDRILFNFLIDRDRDRNDAYWTINCNFRFDFDRNDCIQSSTRFCIVNTLIMILFQLCLTRQLIYVMNDIKLKWHHVLQSIKHFSFEFDKQEVFWQIHFFHKPLKFVSKDMKFRVLVYLNQSRKNVHCRLHFIRICINSFQDFKHLVYDQISTCKNFIQSCRNMFVRFFVQFNVDVCHDHSFDEISIFIYFQLILHNN